VIEKLIKQPNSYLEEKVKDSIEEYIKEDDFYNIPTERICSIL